MEESGNDYVDLSDAIIKLNDIQDASAPSECLMFDRVYVCIICIFCPWWLLHDRMSNSVSIRNAHKDRCVAYIDDVASDEFRVMLQQNLHDQVALSSRFLLVWYPDLPMP